MIKKPVAIMVGLLLLLGGLFKCDAFSSEQQIEDMDTWNNWVRFYQRMS